MALEATLAANLGRHKFWLTAAAMAANDTAGTLLTFRGWALHDRVTLAFRRQPLPPLDDDVGGYQAPFTHPLLDVHGGFAHRPGYYAKLSWQPPIPLRFELFRYDNRANPVFEHARDQRTHVASCIRGVQQHALKAVREERCGKRREQLGVKGLMKIGANQPDDVGSGVDQTLRQPVDAIAEMIGSAHDALASLARNARSRRKRARDRRAGNTGAFGDVCGRNE